MLEVMRLILAALLIAILTGCTYEQTNSPEQFTGQADFGQIKVTIHNGLASTQVKTEKTTYEIQKKITDNFFEYTITDTSDAPDVEQKLTDQSEVPDAPDVERKRTDQSEVDQRDAKRTDQSDTTAERDMQERPTYSY